MKPKVVYNEIYYISIFCYIGGLMNSSFYYLWSNISISKLALSLFTMTMTLSIYKLSNSATLSALVMFVYVIGKFFSSFVFPFISEKYPLQKILKRSMFLQIVILFAVYILLNKATIHSILFLIFLLIWIAGFVDGFSSPSRMALIPTTVTEYKLGRANSLISTTDQVFSLVGWSVGAVLLNRYGQLLILLVSIILLCISFITSIQIKANSITYSATKLKWATFKSGWTMLFNPRNNLRTITNMDILEGVASGIWIGGITLVFVKEVLNKGEQWWGFINTGYFIGSIAGGMLIMLFSHKVQKNPFRAIMIGSFFVSFLVFLYALNKIAVIAILLVILMGPFYQLRDIAQQIFIQKQLREESLAKLYAAKDNLYYLVFTFSVFITGLISDYFGVIFVYYFAGLLYLASSLYAYTQFKRAKSVT